MHNFNYKYTVVAEDGGDGMKKERTMYMSGAGIWQPGLGLAASARHLDLSAAFALRALTMTKETESAACVANMLPAGARFRPTQRWLL
jgi:hypothetical protein